MNGPELVEITRSFTRKVNLGGYESADFFCSQKLEVPEKDAEKASKEAYEFCYNEVIKSVEEFKKKAFNPPQPVAKPAKPRLSPEAREENIIAEYGGEEVIETF